MKIQRKPYDPFKVCTEFSPISFQEYSDKLNRYTNKQLRTLYSKIFHKECTINVVWAKYLIHYELARQQYIKEGNNEPLEKSSQFRKAYMAVRKQDINTVNENLKTLIGYDLKHQTLITEEVLMKKQNAIKKAVEVKNSNRLGVTLGLSVAETWVHVFTINAKEHAVDAKISEFMHKEFPYLKNKAFDTVHSCRVYYNNGGYTKGVKPEIKSLRYDDAGNVVTRMSKTKAVKPAVKAPACPKNKVKVRVKVSKSK